ncbi:MAG: hypothetical protein WC313_12385, partial [Candidatus Kapaibacterium sp.]
MNNSLLRGKKVIQLLALMLMLSFAAVDTYSQDTGPDNYCIPSNDYMPANVNMGYQANFWCYP